MSAFLHPRWLIEQHHKQNHNTFDLSALGSLKKEEKAIIRQEEKMMEDAILFNHILNGARRVKREKTQSKAQQGLISESEKEDVYSSETELSEYEESPQKKVVTGIKAKSNAQIRSSQSENSQVGKDLQGSKKSQDYKRKKNWKRIKRRSR